MASTNKPLNLKTETLIRKYNTDGDDLKIINQESKKLKSQEKKKEIYT